MVETLSTKAREFLAANKKSPVVYGAATHVPGEPEAPENATGCRYTLENGRTFTLKSAELRLMPPPRWKGVAAALRTQAATQKEAE